MVFARWLEELWSPAGVDTHDEPEKCVPALQCVFMSMIVELKKQVSLSSTCTSNALWLPELQLAAPSNFACAQKKQDDAAGALE